MGIPINPIVPIVGGMPGVPIMLSAVLLPHLNALQTHADEFAKLLKLVDELIDNS